MGPTDPEFFSVDIESARRFCLDLNPNASERLTVVCGGVELCTPDYSIERQGFAYHTVEFVARGAGSLTLAGSNYSLRPGTLFAYGPDEDHHIVSDPAAPLVKYFVSIGGTQARALLDEHGPTPGSVILTSSPGDVLNLFDELIRSGLRGSAFSPRIAALVLEQLILRIAETSVSHGLAGGPAFATYLRCRQYIESRWGQISTLEQLARECEVDPAYVCRLFRRFDHQTPYQYLLRQKMTHAANRLTEKGASIKQVADELGFSDPFHFSRVFRKVMGLPPGQFARMHHRP